MPRGDEHIARESVEFFGMTINAPPNEVWVVGCHPKVVKSGTESSLPCGNITAWLSKRDAESWCEKKNQEFEFRCSIRPFQVYRCLLCFEKV